jgi:hypothetical protein
MDENQINAVLAQLLACHQKLDAWDQRNAATTPAQRDQLHEQQDKILENFGQASLLLLQLVGKDISAQAGQLDTLSNQITATADDIAEVLNVINIAEQVVAIAAQIVAIATT